MTSAPPRLFIDTGTFIATLLPHDPDHAAARRVMQRITDGEWQQVNTSDYIIAEVLNFIRRKIKRRETADHFLTLVFGTEQRPPLVDNTLRIHSGHFARALDRYRNEFDRGLSLTDWSTVVAMEDAAISHLATFDAGFHGVVPSLVT